MNIGIIGAGHIGGTTARLFVDAGHQVAISNSRGPETLHELVAEFGTNARAVTPAEAAQFGEIVLLAIPLKDYTNGERGEEARTSMSRPDEAHDLPRILEGGIHGEHCAGDRTARSGATVLAGNEGQGRRHGDAPHG